MEPITKTYFQQVAEIRELIALLETELAEMRALAATTNRLSDATFKALTESRDAARNRDE